MSDQKISLSTLGQGALLEQFEDEFARVIQNIADLNTDPTKVRKLQINVTLKPNEARNIASFEVQTKSTLVPAKPIKTEIFIDKDSSGRAVAVELGKGAIPGQVAAEEYIPDKKVINMK